MTGGGLAINHAINPHGEIVRQQIILGIDFSAFHQGGNFQQVFSQHIPTEQTVQLLHRGGQHLFRKKRCFKSQRCQNKRKCA